MTAAAVEVPKPELATVTPVSPIVPIKVGVFGGQGSGKTTSTALIAAALSKEVYSGAPIFVLDTEPGWQFLKRRVFDVEGVELIQRTTPTFKAMIGSIREAEKLGCCVWAVDSLTVITVTMTSICFTVSRMAMMLITVSSLRGGRSPTKQSTVVVSTTGNV